MCFQARYSSPRKKVFLTTLKFHKTRQHGFFWRNSDAAFTLMSALRAEPAIVNFSGLATTTNSSGLTSYDGSTSRKVFFFPLMGNLRCFCITPVHQVFSVKFVNSSRSMALAKWKAWNKQNFSRFSRVYPIHFDSFESICFGSFESSPSSIQR